MRRWYKYSDIELPMFKLAELTKRTEMGFKGDWIVLFFENGEWNIDREPWPDVEKLQPIDRPKISGLSESNMRAFFPYLFEKYH
jgi:hypothetical protein